MNSKLLLILAIPVVFSCKKGEDDPALSLTSRTKRLEGDWVLKSCKVEGKFDDAGVRVSHFLFTSDGKTYTYERHDTANVNYQGPHELLLHFDKKGQMNIKEQFVEGYNLDGTWDFLNKDGTAKNKERIMLTPRKVTAGTTTEFHALFFGSMERVYHVRELRKDRLVLEYDGKPYTEFGGEILSLTAAFVFER